MLLYPALRETKPRESRITSALIVLDSLFGASKRVLASSFLSFFSLEERSASAQAGSRPATALKAKEAFGAQIQVTL